MLLAVIQKILDRSLMFSTIITGRMSRYASASHHVSPRLSYVIVILKVQEILGAINYDWGFKCFVKYVTNDKFWSIQHVFVIVYVDYVFIWSCIRRSSCCKCCISQQTIMKCGDWYSYWWNMVVSGSLHLQQAILRSLCLVHAEYAACTYLIQ